MIISQSLTGYYIRIIHSIRTIPIIILAGSRRARCFHKFPRLRWLLLQVLFVSSLQILRAVDWSARSYSPAGWMFSLRVALNDSPRSMKSRQTLPFRHRTNSTPNPSLLLGSGCIWLILMQRCYSDAVNQHQSTHLQSMGDLINRTILSQLGEVADIIPFENLGLF